MDRISKGYAATATMLSGHAAANLAIAYVNFGGYSETQNWDTHEIGPTPQAGDVLQGSNHPMGGHFAHPWSTASAETTVALPAEAGI